MNKQGVSRSWFCVFNNPEDNGYEDQKEQQIINSMRDKWIEAVPSGSCALVYCISADGLRHIHAVFEDASPMRFSKIKKIFPKMHIEPTMGNKKEAEDYIKKRGKFKEKDEKVICEVTHGEIQGRQGQKNEFAEIQQMIEEGKTPKQITKANFGYRKYEKLIREAFYERRLEQTPSIRDVKVVLHIGESGSGKSFTRIKLEEEYGEDEIYVMSDYEGGGLDKYCGESVLFMDEFRGQIKFNQLLIMLDKYKSQIHARYTNAYTLWKMVHITSVLPPEEIYSHMVQSCRMHDTLSQLMRRIDTVVYHEKHSDNYRDFAIAGSEYECYEHLITMARRSWGSDISEMEWVKSIKSIYPDAIITELPS